MVGPVLPAPDAASGAASAPVPAATPAAAEFEAAAVPCPFTPEAPSEFEVCTVSSDTLRASIRVAGSLTAHSSGLLGSVLTTHLRAGRRYLRVDVGAVVSADTDVLEALRTTHRAVRELGGMLVFDRAEAPVRAVLDDGELLVSPA